MTFYFLAESFHLMTAYFHQQTDCSRKHHTGQVQPETFNFQNLHQSFSTDHRSSDRLYLLTVHRINISVTLVRVRLLLYHGCSFSTVLNNKKLLGPFFFSMCFSTVINSAPCVQNTYTHIKHVTSEAVDDSYVHPQAWNIIHDSTHSL